MCWATTIVVRPRRCCRRMIKQTIGWYENHQRRSATYVVDGLPCGRGGSSLAPDRRTAIIMMTGCSMSTKKRLPSCARYMRGCCKGRVRTASSRSYQTPALPRARPEAVYAQDQPLRRLEQVHRVKILHNEVYVGVWRFGKHENRKEQGKLRQVKRAEDEQVKITVPVIIDPQTFAQAQEALRRNQVHAKRNTDIPTCCAGWLSVRAGTSAGGVLSRVQGHGR